MACRLNGAKPSSKSMLKHVLLIGHLGYLKWNSNIFIQENALENVVCEMASILSGPQCVNILTKLRPVTYISAGIDNHLFTQNKLVLEYITVLWVSDAWVCMKEFANIIIFQSYLIKMQQYFTLFTCIVTGLCVGDDLGGRKPEVWQVRAE